MRLRKPIHNKLREFKMIEQIDERTRFENTKTGKPGSENNQKSIVTINIKCCKSLSSAAGDADKIRAYFYYQFYTFDEKMSHITNGSNPMFRDT